MATVSKSAQPQIADLWHDSFDAGREMLTCLRVRRDTIQALGERRWVGGKHAIGNGVAEDVESHCSPPEWNGLIHTHPNNFVTLSGRQMNQRWPYLTSADMNAAARWVARHREEGLFCVVSGPGEAGVKCVRMRVQERAQVADG